MLVLVVAVVAVKAHHIPANRHKVNKVTKECEEEEE